MHAVNARVESRTAPVAQPAEAPTDHRTARILARSMFKDMKRYGIPNDRILEVASELIGLVTEELPGEED